MQRGAMQRRYAKWINVGETKRQEDDGCNFRGLHLYAP